MNFFGSIGFFGRKVKARTGKLNNWLLGGNLTWLGNKEKTFYCLAKTSLQEELLEYFFAGFLSLWFL